MVGKKRSKSDRGKANSKDEKKTSSDKPKNKRLKNVKAPEKRNASASSHKKASSHKTASSSGKGASSKKSTKKSSSSSSKVKSMEDMLKELKKTSREYSEMDDSERKKGQSRKASPVKKKKVSGSEMDSVLGEPPVPISKGLKASLSTADAEEENKEEQDFNKEPPEENLRGAQGIMEPANQEQPLSSPPVQKSSDESNSEESKYSEGPKPSVGSGLLHASDVGTRKELDDKKADFFETLVKENKSSETRMFKDSKNSDPSPDIPKRNQTELDDNVQRDEDILEKDEESLESIDRKYSSLLSDVETPARPKTEGSSSAQEVLSSPSPPLPGKKSFKGEAVKDTTEPKKKKGFLASLFSRKKQPERSPLEMIDDSLEKLHKEQGGPDDESSQEKMESELSGDSLEKEFPKRGEDAGTKTAKDTQDSPKTEEMARKNFNEELSKKKKEIDGEEAPPVPPLSSSVSSDMKYEKPSAAPPAIGDSSSPDGPDASLDTSVEEKLKKVPLPSGTSERPPSTLSEGTETPQGDEAGEIAKEAGGITKSTEENADEHGMSERDKNEDGGAEQKKIVSNYKGIDQELYRAAKKNENEQQAEEEDAGKESAQIISQKNAETESEDESFFSDEGGDSMPPPPAPQFTDTGPEDSIMKKFLEESGSKEDTGPDGSSEDRKTESQDLNTERQDLKTENQDLNTENQEEDVLKEKGSQEASEKDQPTREETLIGHNEGDFSEDVSRGSAEKRPDVSSEGPLERHLPDEDKASSEMQELLKQRAMRIEKDKLALEQREKEFSEMRAEFKKERERFAHERRQFEQTLKDMDQVKLENKNARMLSISVEKLKEKEQKLLQRLRSLEKDIAHKSASFESREKKLSEWEEFLDKKEHELDERENMLLTMQTDIIKERRELDDREFQVYMKEELAHIPTKMSNKDYEAESARKKFEEKLSPRSYNIRAMINQTRNMLLDGKTTDAKAAYNRIARDFQDASLETEEKKKLHLLILELYNDVQLAEQKK